jgi:hypothetical protein
MFIKLNKTIKLKKMTEEKIIVKKTHPLDDFPITQEALDGTIKRYKELEQSFRKVLTTCSRDHMILVPRQD